MAVSGDFMRLALLRDRLKHMAGGQARRDMLRALADETQRQIIAGFNAKRDPYGRAWAPRKPPPAWAARAFGLMQRSHPLLDDTGRMIDSMRSRPSGGAVLVTGLGYAEFHQEGTRLMVARRLLPAPVLGLGPTWGDAYLMVSRMVANAYGVI